MTPAARAACGAARAAARTAAAATATATATAAERIRHKLNDILEAGRKATANDKRIAIPVDGQFVSIDCIHLRDSCKCHLCIDPSTQQKLFQTQDIPLNIRPKEYKVDQFTGAIHIVWRSAFGGANHVTQLSANDLRNIVNLKAKTRSRFDDFNYVLWDKAIMEKDIQFIPFEEYMQNEEVLYFALQQLVAYGLVFLKEVPQDPNIIEKIAEKIGNIKETFYGRTWDVKSVQNSKNIAYTPLNLGLHMDLLYFESPPGLQFLHCLQNTVTGGSSYFADSFRAAEWIRINSINCFSALTKNPVNFHYKNDGQYYHFSRPTIVLDEHGYHTRKRILHVNYSPPFQAPFDPPAVTGDIALWRQFVHALKIFGSLVDDPINQFELRLAKGEVAIFQNRRVLHARREFDPKSGDRWLKGTYVDGDAYRSKLRILTEKFQKKKEQEESDKAFSYIR
ncbi:hypothetical protein BDZ91DRAFT_813319 [Kalaharituber pfeilii]|nr:hypothetical protein BDZ91DRAFT_813319 [Kalaharituber pfeilii]